MALNRVFGRSDRQQQADTDRTVRDGNQSQLTGVMLGVVKNNLDPARRGRLQVWIPNHGGNSEEPSTWKTVAYASPFFGSTGFPNSQPTNEFEHTNNTYGMWFSSPDINNFVLVAFVNGDAQQGYWFASVPSVISHYMVPAMGAIPTGSVETESTDGVIADQYPVAEHNEKLQAVNSYAKFPLNKKPAHKIQWKILYDQGLEKDTVRGTITSSSHRESPSRVFGISTPGRPITEKTGKKTSIDRMVSTRKGGHTFVLDDGDAEGKDQLVRLRSAGGHQIMMNDTNEIIYIANSAGTAWLEFDTSGKIHLYGKDSINLRTEKDFNFHADKDMNFHSKGTINMYADTLINFESTDIKSKAVISINSEAGTSITELAGASIIETAGVIHMNGPAAPAVTAIVQQSLGDTVKAGKIWTHSSTTSTIVKILPTHEPSSTVHTARTSGAKGPL